MVMIKSNMVKVILFILIPQTKVRAPIVNQFSKVRKKTCSELIIEVKVTKVIIQQQVIMTQIKYLNPFSEINLEPPNKVQHKKLKKGRHKMINIIFYFSGFKIIFITKIKPSISTFTIMSKGIRSSL